MKKIQRTVALVVGLICLLSVQHLSAQTYDVNVVLGRVGCGQPTLGNDIVAIQGGTIEVGSGNNLSVQTASLHGKMTNSQAVIFDGTFSTQPTLMTINIPISSSNPGGCDIGTGQQLQSVNISSAFTSPVAVPFTINLDGGGELEVLVTASSFTLIAGSIGLGQSICENHNLTLNPITIGSGAPAQGGAGIVYVWEYSTSKTGVYSTAELPTGATEFTSTYPLSSLSETRWYRRVATLGDQTKRTAPVEIKVLPQSVPKYRVEFFLTGYECSSDGSLTNAQQDLSLNFGEGNFSFQGITPSSVTPAYQYDFDEVPASFSLSSSFSSSTGSCPGVFLESALALPPLNIGIGDYELVQGAEKLKYTIRLTEVENFALAGGEIEIDGVSAKTICLDSGPLNFTEKTAAGVSGADYEWQWSINDGRTWTSVASSNDINFTVQAPTMTTWYRRGLLSNCQKGVSNTVVITVEYVLVDFSGLDANYESDAASVLLTGVPAGGVFSGSTGLSGDTFDPAQSEGAEVAITYTYTSATGCVYTKTKITFVEAKALCSTRIPLGNSGAFMLDKFSGRIVYQRAENCTPDIEIPCIQTEPLPPILEGVVSASAVTLADEWDYTSYTQSRYNTTLANANTFETGTSGKWRVQNSYVYRSSEINRDKNYNTGTFDLPVFNWRYEDVNQSDKWIRASTVAKYSPNGEALEEYNAINISSTVKMGYYDNVPYLTAQNATYESVFFESFETTYGSGNVESGAFLHPNADLDGTVAHAGSQSLALDPYEGLLTPFMYISDQVNEMMVQVWVKGEPNEELSAIIFGGEDPSSTLSMTEIARSGDWGLYQSLMPVGNNTFFKIAIRYEGTQSIRIDDMKVQPVDAEMTCYVYDPETLRLLTVFDGQHFGLYYQYDGEGKLVRKMIETERGIRTVQETFYNVPEVNKATNQN